MSNPYNKDVSKSVLHLRQVNTALSSFHHHFNDLNSHLNSILSSINSLLPPNLSINSTITPPISLNSPITPPDPISHIATLCKSMKGNTLRKHILTHFSKPVNLIPDLIAGLNLCPNPPKLVLDCVGQFYILGINAYKKNPGLNRLRQASVLMLQLFLPMASGNWDGDGTEGLVREEAEKKAVEWQKRMMSRGGIAKAWEIDAKGLLLFIGCFGVPDVFEDDDLLGLVKACNGRKISGLLCRSSILVEKMKEIIEALQEKESNVEALDISLTFRLEDRYSPASITKYFVLQSKRAGIFGRELQEKMKWNQAMVLYETQLANFKSLLKCLEEHKVHPSDLLPEWNPIKDMTWIEQCLAELENTREPSEVELELILEPSEVGSLCESMNGNSLREYVISHLSETEKLIEEVPKALKLCSNPAKLLLDCIGKFYLLGTNEYQHRASPNQWRRQASVLLLQLFFSVVSESETKESVREQAVTAAVAWRERILKEGELGKASEIDAKGLLLFIGCFGTPDEFEDDDVLDLLRASNGKEISGLLRLSGIFVKKMKEILEAKQKMGLNVEALDISFTFHLYDDYSPGKIITTFLIQSRKNLALARKSRVNWNLNQAILLFKKQLTNFDSLLKCFQEHKVHPSDHMKSWDPKKKMNKIEIELAELERMREKSLKEERKRKADQLEPLVKAEFKDDPSVMVEIEDECEPFKRNARRNARRKQMKRARRRNGPEEQNSVSVPSSINNLPNSSPVLNRDEPVLSPGVGCDDRRPYHIEDALYSERFVGQGFTEPERFVGRSYVGIERFVGRSYVELEKFVGGSYVESVDRRSNGLLSSDPISNLCTRYLKHAPAGNCCNPVQSSDSEPDRFVGRSYVKPVDDGANALVSSSRLSDYYRKRYTEPMPAGNPIRNQNSDIYGFADAVLEAETYGGSRASDTVPSTCRPSYLY